MGPDRDRVGVKVGFLYMTIDHHMAPRLGFPGTGTRGCACDVPVAARCDVSRPTLLLLLGLLAVPVAARCDMGRPTLLLAGLYPDPEPAAPHEPDLRPRLAALEAEVERYRVQAAQADKAKGSASDSGTGWLLSNANHKAFDTFSLRASLGLWLLLGLVASRGRPVSAATCSVFALIGSGVTLISLVGVLIKYVKRHVLGIVPPRIRCYKCLTPFEYEHCDAVVVACPHCGAKNGVRQPKA